MQLMDGKLVADQIKAEIAKEIQKDFLNKGKNPPHLAAVLVGVCAAPTKT